MSGSAFAAGLVVMAIFAGCGRSLPSPEPPGPLAMRERSGAIVVVKIKPPWYATRGMIVRRFRTAVPQYQAAKGLERKQFSLASNGAYGGVYLWTERATADEWFGPAWHARVKRERGHDGDVRFISVTRGLDAPLSQRSFEGPMVVAIAAGRLESYQGASGLRAAYEGDGVVVSTWQDRSHANAVLGARRDVEWFSTPVGLFTSTCASACAAR